MSFKSSVPRSYFVLQCHMNVGDFNELLGATTPGYSLIHFFNEISHIFVKKWCRSAKTRKRAIHLTVKSRNGLVVFFHLLNTFWITPPHDCTYHLFNKNRRSLPLKLSKPCKLNQATPILKQSRLWLVKQVRSPIPCMATLLLLRL